MVSCLSVATLVYAREASFGAFVGAFGGGVALRVFVLAVLMVAAWGRPSVQAAMGVTYIVSVMFLLLLEYRHLRVS